MCEQTLSSFKTIQRDFTVARQIHFTLTLVFATFIILCKKYNL